MRESDASPPAGLRGPREGAALRPAACELGRPLDDRGPRIPRFLTRFSFTDATLGDFPTRTENTQ